MTITRFRYPSVAESEKRMLDDVSAWLRRHPAVGSRFQPICLAVSEAFTNALTHANQYDPEKTITIELSINENTFTADISDEGAGGLAKIRNHKPPGQLADHGRGIDLIEHYASAVTLHETDSGGLRLHIVFDLKTTTKETV